MITRSKTIHRLLSLVLCLCMVLTLLPMIPMEAEAAAAKTLYLKPNDNWTQANARFAAYFFKGTSKNTWVSMTATIDGLYKVDVPAGDWPNVIFCRMNPNTTANNWNNGTMWNQTGDLTIPTDGKNLFTVPNSAWDGSTSSWSTRTSPGTVTVYCINSSQWTTVYAYAFKGDIFDTAWHGAQMDKTGDKINGFDVYKYTFEKGYSNIIFNNGDRYQTGDLTIQNGQYYDLKAAKWMATVDALGTNAYLGGDFNVWKPEESEFRLDTKNTTVGYISVPLEANKTYEFKVMRDYASDEWSSCTTAITDSVEGLTFSTNVSANCKITTKAAGTYVFSFDLNTYKLSVEYPCDHKWADATCLAPKTCSVCGATEGKVAGHSWQAATCDAPKTCSVCGATEGEALGHKWSDATCDAPKTCSVCGATEGEALGHKWSDATCDAPKTCSVCGATEGEALGHSYSAEITTAPGCETTGVKTYTCGTCGDSYTEDVAALGHAYEAKVTDPDCVNGGHTTHTCGNCGHSYTDSERPALGHSYSAEITTAPGCETTGVKTYTCGTCGDAYNEPLAATGHSYKAEVTAPDCTNGGYTTYTCACGHSYVADKTEALGHTDEVVPGYAADCTNTGLTDGSKCAVCGETLIAQEIIPATGIHADADKNYRCDSCNKLMQDAQLAKVSVSLKGNIAVNYYMLLTEEVAADRNAYMYFKLVDGELTIPVSKGVPMELEGETYYVYTCAVDAKEMTDNIVSQFFYGNNVTREHTYNVQTYGKHILAAYDDQATRDLITAMLNYGAASQLHFGYNTDKLANDVRDDKGNALIAAPDYSDVTIDGFQAVAGQGTELAKFYSASLILKSETTVRFFFQVNADATFTASYNGQELTVSKRGSLHYVDVVGISAKDLDEDVTITINDGTNSKEVSFNPMSYCQGVLNDTTGAFSNEMKDLVRALYLYNQAANVYFKEV